jgi:DNA-directed RNA polymerase subunit RPC12/RpoP
MLAETEPMIRYTCARCKKSLESPVSLAGQKVHCPDCNQRLQIPQPATPPPPPVNKTILATEELTGSLASNVPSPDRQLGLAPPARRATPPPPAQVEPVEETPSRVASKRSARRESCLECGLDLTQQSRVQTCPDCGSVLCSARCFREHHRHAHARKRKVRTEYVECTRCGSSAQPYETTAISEGGWVLFAVLLIFFFPLCWIGLLMTQTRVTCADCGARIP